MELKTYFAEQLEKEIAAARKAIERFPEGRNSWKPHPKSMELGYLAALVATMPGWLATMIDYDEIDLNGKGKTFMTKAVDTRAELLSMLEKSAAESRMSLSNTTEEHLMTPWRLTWDDRVLIHGPRYQVIADAALSHMAHHRGQFTVYLRLNDASVPALYGPSADEAE